MFLNPENIQRWCIQHQRVLPAGLPLSLHIAPTTSSKKTGKLCCTVITEGDSDECMQHLSSLIWILTVGQ